MNTFSFKKFHDLDRMKKIAFYSTSTNVQVGEDALGQSQPTSDSNMVEVATAPVSETITNGESTAQVTDGQSNNPISFYNRTDKQIKQLLWMFEHERHIRENITLLLNEFKEKARLAKNKHWHMLQQKHMPDSLMAFYQELVPQTSDGLKSNITLMLANHGKRIIDKEINNEMHRYMACITKIAKLFIRIILLNKIIKTIQAKQDSSYVKVYEQVCLMITRFCLDLSPLLTLVSKPPSVNLVSKSSPFTSAQTYERIGKILDEASGLLRECLIPGYTSYTLFVMPGGPDGASRALSISLERILPVFRTRCDPVDQSKIATIPRFTCNAEYLIHLLRVYLVKFAAPRVLFPYSIALTWPKLSVAQHKQLIAYLDELYPLLIFITCISDKNELPANIFPDGCYIRLNFEDFFLIRKIEGNANSDVLFMSNNSFANLIYALEHTMLNLLVYAMNTLK